MFEFKKEKAALIIVDMQNDFCRPGAPMCVDDALGTVPQIKKLIGFSRKNGIPIVFTKFLSGPVKTFAWDWSPEIESDATCKRGHYRDYADIGKRELCADVIDELKPIEPEDYIVEKYCYSAFRNTPLIDILASEGRDTIIVTGTVTNICVEDTIHDGFANKLKVIVASDGVSTFSPLQQQATLENAAHKYGVVCTTDEIIERF